jgi:hypothetical protein
MVKNKLGKTELQWRRSLCRSLPAGKCKQVVASSSSANVSEQTLLAKQIHAQLKQKVNKKTLHNVQSPPERLVDIRI